MSGASRLVSVIRVLGAAAVLLGQAGCGSGGVPVSGGAETVAASAPVPGTKPSAKLKKERVSAEVQDQTKLKNRKLK